MELRTSSYVMLGMLRIGARSGYEIRRSAELSLRFFWAISPRQIYAELRALEEGGLVTGSDDPRGSLQRRMFTLTDDGEAALARWIADLTLGDFEWRDLGLLKLFFSDVATPDERRALLGALRARAEAMQDHFNDVVLPAGAITREKRGQAMPEVTAQFGIEFWEWMAGWCERYEAALDAGQPPTRAGASARTSG